MALNPIDIAYLSGVNDAVEFITSEIYRLAVELPVHARLGEEGEVEFITSEINQIEDLTLSIDVILELINRRLSSVRDGSKATLTDRSAR